MKKKDSAALLKRDFKKWSLLLQAEGFHRSTLYRYASGKMVPSAHHAAVIERATGIPANGWVLP